MSDYEAKPPQPRSIKESYSIPGQKKKFCKDVREADAHNLSYGQFMRRKSQEDKIIFKKVIL